MCPQLSQEHLEAFHPELSESPAQQWRVFRRALLVVLSVTHPQQSYARLFLSQLLFEMPGSLCRDPSTPI